MEIISEETLEPTTPVREVIVPEEEIAPVMKDEIGSYWGHSSLEEIAPQVEAESLAYEEDMAPAVEVGDLIIDSMGSGPMDCVVELLEPAQKSPLEGIPILALLAIT